jgi:hypothetical protein
VSCPRCGLRGDVVWDDAGRPGYPAKPRLLELSAGFVAVEVSAKEPARILCGACRVPAETIP